MKTEEMAPPGSRAAIALKRILVPIDFSPLSQKALHYAVRFAREFDTELDLLYVLEPEIPPAFDGFMIAPPAANGAVTTEGKALKALVKEAKAAGAENTSGAIRRGLASHEIVEAAKDLSVDLIVIATHGYTGWKHFCIGSTAERVVRAAPCPVLVVREKEHEFCP